MYEDERNEVVEKITNAKALLLAAVDELEVILEDEHADVCDISNDAYYAIAAMLKGISNDYDVQQLAQDAVA